MANAPTVITAARFALKADGEEIASFSELSGIKTEIKTTEFVESGENGLVQMNIPANPVLCQIVFKRAQTTDLKLWAWHEAARRGEMGAARRTCSIVMYDNSENPVATYHLEGTWISKMELSALRAGSADVLQETVTLVCDHLLRVQP